MTLVEEIAFVLFVSLCVVAIVWPSLVILGGYSDDPDNWLAGFFFGVVGLVWVFVL